MKITKTKLKKWAVAIRRNGHFAKSAIEIEVYCPIDRERKVDRWDRSLPHRVTIAKLPWKTGLTDDEIIPALTNHIEFGECEEER